MFYIIKSCADILLNILIYLFSKPYEYYSKRVFLGPSADQTQSTQTANDGIFTKIKKALLG